MTPHDQRSAWGPYVHSSAALWPCCAPARTTSGATYSAARSAVRGWGLGECRHSAHAAAAEGQAAVQRKTKTDSAAVQSRSWPKGGAKGCKALAARKGARRSGSRGEPVMTVMLFSTEGVPFTATLQRGGRLCVLVHCALHSSTAQHTRSPAHAANQQVRKGNTSEVRRPLAPSQFRAGREGGVLMGRIVRSAAQRHPPKVCDFHGAHVSRRRQQQILQLEVPVGHPPVPKIAGMDDTRHAHSARKRWCAASRTISQRPCAPTQQAV
jgi:hypothetical protein